MSPSLIARYFNRVLGVHTVPFRVELTAQRRVAPLGEASSNSSPEPIVLPSAVVLLDVRDSTAEQSPLPSLEVMGARLLEALRTEWLKKSSDQLPAFEWLRASPVEWREAALDGGPRTKLVIVCGARDVHQTPSNVLHVPSLAEMQASPVVKREAWRMIQLRIGQTN